MDGTKEIDIHKKKNMRSKGMGMVYSVNDNAKVFGH